MRWVLCALVLAVVLIAGCVPLHKTYFIGPYVESVKPLPDGSLKVRTCKRRVRATSAGDRTCKTRIVKPAEEDD